MRSRRHDRLPLILHRQTKGNKGSVTLELAKPAGAVVGDVLIASIDLRGLQTSRRRTDWTLLGAKRTAGSGNDALQKSTYWHTVTARRPGRPCIPGRSRLRPTRSEPSLAYGGVDTSSFVANSQANAAGDGSRRPHVTAGTAGSRLVGFFTTATTATFTPPTGMAERCEIVELRLGQARIRGSGQRSRRERPDGPGRQRASKSAVSIGQLVVLRPASYSPSRRKQKPPSLRGFVPLGLCSGFPTRPQPGRPGVHVEIRACEHR